MKELIEAIESEAQHALCVRDRYEARTNYDGRLIRITRDRQLASDDTGCTISRKYMEVSFEFINQLIDSQGRIERCPDCGHGRTLAERRG